MNFQWRYKSIAVKKDASYWKAYFLNFGTSYGESEELVKSAPIEK